MARTRILAASFLGLVTLVAVVAGAVLFLRMPDTAGQPATGISAVQATVENVGFSGAGDISDDSAIWVDPDDPGNSVVVADNKADDGGIGVFGMDGRLIDF